MENRSPKSPPTGDKHCSRSERCPEGADWNSSRSEKGDKPKAYFAIFIGIYFSPSPQPLSASQHLVSRRERGLILQFFIVFRSFYTTMFFQKNYSEQ